MKRKWLITETETLIFEYRQRKTPGSSTALPLWCTEIPFQTDINQLPFRNGTDCDDDVTRIYFSTWPGLAHQKLASPLLVQITASIGTEHRLYWYRGVTVLQPGWVIYVFCPCKSSFHWAVDYCPHCRSPLGRVAQILCWLYNPYHNHVNAAPKQASLQTHFTSTPPCNPQAKLLYVKYRYWSQYQYC